MIRGRSSWIWVFLEVSVALFLSLAFISALLQSEKKTNFVA